MAYGELTPRGVRQVFKLLQPTADDVFYDLGSGCGRCVLQAILEWPFLRRSVGIELSAQRDRIGQQALARAGERVRERADLIRGDIIVCDGCEDATIVYCASLLFDDAFMRRLGERLVGLPQLRTVATLTRFPDGALPGFAEHERNFAPESDETTRRERVEVTWGAARVFLYTRQSPTGR